MVISRVVSSLIINFSPWLVCLPAAVRSVCVSAASSAGSTHYTRCGGMLLWNCDAETVWNENRMRSSWRCITAACAPALPRATVPGTLLMFLPCLWQDSICLHVGNCPGSQMFYFPSLTSVYVSSFILGCTLPGVQNPQTNTKKNKEKQL